MKQKKNNKQLIILNQKEKPLKKQKEIKPED